ncbi:mechanosensitive channel protein, partial [Klebsiella pneumoniae]|nr:mechanosensitive channel protein [Klebsiella pneumoniae]
LPLTLAGAFIIDPLLLALTLFVGPLLSDRLNGNNPTLAFQQSLFLNAFPLIEFFKPFLRLIFCPPIPALRPFNLSDEAA